MRWFRFYDDAINDPKILKLPEATRWHWTALLCIASKNDGVLPSTEDVALMLRVKTSAAAAIIATLKAAGLLDLVDGRFSPHNWNGRQYKSDVSTERVKRFRNGKRNVSETPPEAEQSQNTDTDVADAAEARPSGGLVGPEAMVLAEKLLVIAGHKPDFWPPGWCGAPMRVQMWLDQGWKSDIIVAAVTSAAARKRGGLANSVQFFEKAIAEETARQAAPLPVVEVREAEKLTVTHGRIQEARQSLPDAARRLAENGISFGPKPELPTLRSITGSSDVRLLPQSGGERPGDIRSGSVGSLERLPAGGDRLHHGPEDGAAEQVAVVAERVRGPAGM